MPKNRVTSVFDNDTMRGKYFLSGCPHDLRGVGACIVACLAGIAHGLERSAADNDGRLALHRLWLGHFLGACRSDREGSPLEQDVLTTVDALATIAAARNGQHACPHHKGAVALDACTRTGVVVVLNLVVGCGAALRLIIGVACSADGDVASQNGSGAVALDALAAVCKLFERFSKRFNVSTR